MLPNCGGGEDSWEFLGQQEDQTCQPWIFMGRTDAEAEGPILWPPDTDSRFIGKDPDAGKDWGQEEKGRQKVRWLDGFTDSVDMSLSKLWETVKVREPWSAIVYGVTESWAWLSFWTTTTSPGDSTSSNPERIALRRQREESGYREVCKKGQVVWTSKDYW